MLSTGTNIRSSRGGSHVPRKAYGRFEFLVCDWSLMKSSPGENIVSQEFVMSDSSSWVLTIFPGGSSSRQAGFVSVHMGMAGLGNSVGFVTATFNISVLGRKDMRQAHDPKLDPIYSLKSPSAMDFCLDSEAQSTWAVDNFMLAQELEEKYMDNDAVLFALDIEVLGKPELLSTTMPTYVGPLCTLADDFGTLFSDPNEAGAFSDITLVSGQKRLKCHRSILAARSEVLKKKFLTNTFQAKLLFNGGCYHLDEMPANVFHEMVHFIYTDCCNNDVMALQDRDLLTVAVRFKLVRLIQLCEDHIGETLTADNVIAALNLAADLKSERLDVCCSEFISTHQNDVLATKTLCHLQPEALKDLIAKSILPASSLLLAGAAASTPITGPTPSATAGKDEATEEVKEDTAKEEVVATAAEKLKSDADFIPAAGGMAKKEDFTAV